MYGSNISCHAQFMEGEETSWWVESSPVGAGLNKAKGWVWWAGTGPVRMWKRILLIHQILIHIYLQGSRSQCFMLFIVL